MPYKLAFKPEALIDAIEAMDRHALTRHELDQEFLADMAATVEQIIAGPEFFGLIMGPVRSAKFTRFPYYLAFEVQESAIKIYRVLPVK